MSASVLSRAALVAYGAPALPLAIAALPIYVHVPKFYADTLGMDLATVGIILLLLRLLDGFSDPLLGAWSDHSGDRAVDHAGNRSRMVAWSLPLLAAGMIALLNPPAATPGWLAGWLAVSVAIAYAGYSLATINHHALGAELSRDSYQRTRVTAVRESIALGGVMVAAVVPGLFFDARDGMRALSWVFAGALLLGAGLFLWRSPRPHGARPVASPVFAALPSVLRVVAFRRLLAVYMANGIAAAIPATLVLFFVKDVIGNEAAQGWFLGAYFLAGAIAMPLWVVLSRRVGKRRAWVASMVLAIASFVWAWGLGPGDTMPFLVICALSGIAFAADLALPPSMLADAIDTGPRELGAGTYFGVWTLATKLNLALAAGIALPLLQWLGYRPGVPTAGGSAALAAVYAGVPCVLKLLAAGLALVLLRTSDAASMAPVRTVSSSTWR